MSDTLFPLPEATPGRGDAGSAPPRVLRPNRQQLELRPADLEGLLPAEHRARVVWQFVEGLDLGPLYAQVQAVEGHAGRPAIDPAILMALWLYATLEGVGSARAVARLCEEHDAYRWICGGVAVNYHTLADFRVDPGEVLDELLSTSVAALMAEGLVDLQRVAHDGVKVRASAGAGSFRHGGAARAVGGRGHGAGRGVEAGSARRPWGERAAAGGGAAARGAGAAAAGRAGLGATARGRSAPPEGGGERAGARVDDGSGRAADEDGRRRRPPGVQRANHDGDGQPSDRRRGAHERRHRSGAAAADGRAAAAALRGWPGGGAGRWRVRGPPGYPGARRGGLPSVRAAQSAPGAGEGVGL